MRRGRLIVRHAAPELVNEGSKHDHHHVRFHRDRDRGPPRDPRGDRRLALLLDARDWSALEQVFTDTVYSDRTSLYGGEPVTLGAAEFVSGWRQVLGNLDAVHHLISCHVISLDGDHATCAANMQGTHVMPTPRVAPYGPSAAATTTSSNGPVTVGGSPD